MSGRLGDLDLVLADGANLAAKCAAIRTAAAFPMLADECLLRAYAGDPNAPEWLPVAQATRWLAA